MKKLLLKTFIVFSFLLSSAIAKAQWVTIPDTNFANFLQVQYPSCMNGNLMNTNCGDIINEISLSIQNSNISDLTGIEYFSNLTSLYCSGSPIETFPTLPLTLQFISAHDCYLQNLNNLPAGLYSLGCANNIGLTSASFSNLPSSLRILQCQNNILSSLPTLPPLLEQLYCQDNILTSLPTFPSTLQILYCYNNQLVALPNCPSPLTDIRCYNNQLTSLPDLNDSMDVLIISDNPNLLCLPKYKRINTFYWSNTGIACLPNAGYIGNAIPSVSGLPFCQPPSGCFLDWNIYGRGFNEINTNCLKDSNELIVRNIPVMLDSGGALLQNFLTNNEGYYSFQTGLGNYEIKIDTTGLPFDVLCPSGGIHFSTLTAIDSLDADLDFGFQCKPGYLDLEAKSISTHLGPGSQRRLYLGAGDATLFYGVTGLIGVSGSVEAILNNLVSYVAPVNGALTPSVNGDTLAWSIPDFSTVDPLTAFNVIVQVDSNATIGDTACFQLNIYPFSDSNPTNNSLTHCFPIVNSVDPNAKEIYPGGLVDTTQHDFTFTVYFQNTGTASADNIYILDTLDNDLDAATFQFLSSSHDPVTQLLPGNILRFSFPHINLADSTTNEQQSHGYVQFKVRRKNIYYSGMSITNRAYIYFDFNPAVATNEAIAWFDNNLGITEPPRVAFTVYPNPARDIINIETYSQINTLLQIELFDITGRKLQTIVNQRSRTGNTQLSFSVEDLTKGVYILKLNDGVRRIIVD